MATTHDVAVRLGGRALRAWDDVTVTRDMLQAGSPWTVSVWRDGRGEDFRRVLDAAQPYASVSVEVDGAPQLRGTLERIRHGASRQGEPLILSGRDAVAAAMVADVDPAISLRGATLEGVIARALEPLGLSVVVGADADEARRIEAGARPGARTAARGRRRHSIDRFKPKPGEKVWSFIESLCRRHGFLVWSAPYGDGVGLVIDRPTERGPATQTLARRRGVGGWTGNILSGFHDVDVTEVPSEVTVFGHGSLTASADAKHRARLVNERLRTELAGAPMPARPRYLRDPRARTPQIATQRARLELARANASLSVYEATVQGYADAGRLWTVNTLVTLDDEVTGLRGPWLVTRVTFLRSRASGHSASLRLVPRGALVVEPDPEV